MTGDEPGDTVIFERDRLHKMLELLERMAAGDTTVHLPLSDKRDELDAIAHAVNVLSDELRWTSSRMVEAEQRRVSALLRSRETDGRATG